MSYKDRMGSPGPKKLLALDGGGIRGVITLEVLQRIESMLAQQLGAGDDFVLADYFDYIGGTSTGAVIAAGFGQRAARCPTLDLYVARGERCLTRLRCCIVTTTATDVERLKGLSASRPR